MVIQEILYQHLGLKIKHLNSTLMDLELNEVDINALFMHFGFGYIKSIFRRKSKYVISNTSNPTFHINNFLPGGTITQSTIFMKANIARLVIPCPPPDIYCDNPRGRSRKTLLVTKTKILVILK